MRGNLVALMLFSFVVNGFSQSFKQTGLASFYADKFEGRSTANGEKYKHSKLTAAHKTLPFGTVLKVKNLENGKVVTVRVNDRGPFVKGRIIDLSKSAAKKLDFIDKGITKVEIVVTSNTTEDRNTNSSLYIPSIEKKSLQDKYYSLSVNERNLSGYGVQIGSYKELVNLVLLANELEKSYNDRIFIQVSIIQEVKYYKIIVGSLKDRPKAEKLNEELRDNYPGSFVIKF